MSNGTNGMGYGAGNGVADGEVAKEGYTQVMTGRGGYRPGSGRPPLAPDKRRQRMSVGFTPENLRWLRTKAITSEEAIARVINDLIDQEKQREQFAQEAEALSGELLADVN